MISKLSVTALGFVSHMSYSPKTQALKVDFNSHFVLLAMLNCDVFRVWPLHFNYCKNTNKSTLQQSNNTNLGFCGLV